jgi:hypothetical protein
LSSGRHPLLNCILSVRFFGRLFCELFLDWCAPARRGGSRVSAAQAAATAQRACAGAGVGAGVKVSRARARFTTARGRSAPHITCDRAPRRRRWPRSHRAGQGERIIRKGNQGDKFYIRRRRHRRRRRGAPPPRMVTHGLRAALSIQARAARRAPRLAPPHA